MGWTVKNWVCYSITNKIFRKSINLIFEDSIMSQDLDQFYRYIDSLSIKEKNILSDKIRDIDLSKSCILDFGLAHYVSLFFNCFPEVQKYKILNSNLKLIKDKIHELNNSSDLCIELISTINENTNILDEHLHCLDKKVLSIFMKVKLQDSINRRFSL